MKPSVILCALGWLAAGAVAVEPPPALAEAATDIAAPGTAVGPPAKPAIKQLSPTRYQLGPIEFDKVTREISFPAKVNMVKGVLEYIIVHEQGKLHESLLSTRARPFDLNVVLLLLNYQPMPEWFDPPGKPRSLDGVKAESRIDFFVSWQEAKGGRKTARLENWVTDMRTNKPAPHAPWVYNGSGLNAESQFCAEVDGSVAALYLDDRSLLNSPRPGNSDDERWEPARGIPPKGTPVTVVLKPPTTLPAQ